MDTVVVVTGASRGIGAAVARLAAARGRPVCVNYLTSEAAAQAVVADIEAAGGRALAVRADVAEETEVEHLFDAAGALGPLGALVNNAGILARQSDLLGIDAARIDRVLRTNVTGAFLAAKAAVRRMSTAHGGAGGAIVNVSSMAARLGAANEYLDYAASKGAIDTFTIGLAREVADQGIRVNAVRPGLIDTDIHASGGEAGRVARLGPGVPMGRGGKPGEVAEAVLWLISTAASYVTGTFIDVSGGR